MILEPHVRELLRHYFIAPRAVMEKYRERLQDNPFGWVDLSFDWVLLAASFGDEDTQNEFVAQPGVLALPHFTSSDPLSPSIVAKLSEFEEWREAPTQNVDAFVEWVTENRLHLFGSEIHRARLRIKRHARLTQWQTEHPSA